MRIVSRVVLPLSLAVAAVPSAAAAQGSCRGRPAEHTPACDTTPWKDPFASTGWKTTAVDHFTMEAVDYKKAVGYYSALMNWKLRSDDGKQAVMDIGDIATVIIKGGYQPPAPTPPPAPAAGDSTAGRRGRGGPRTPPSEVWDGISLAISPWNANKVKAELEKRGLNPVADNDPKIGFESFHVKDPDGFDVQVSNGAYARMRAANKGKPGMTVANEPFEHTNWKTVWLDHISFGVTNYKESVAWYRTLLGWKPTGDEGSQDQTIICEECGDAIIRGGNPNNTARPMPAVRRASFGHIAFGLEGFDYVAVKAELDKRGLQGREDTGSSKKIDDPTAQYKSYHTPTSQGFDLQISNGTKAARDFRP